MEAALAADRIVVTLDAAFRDLFRAYLSGRGDSRQVQWVVLGEAIEEIEPWLRRGARSVRRWRLVDD